ncbi:alpha/beta fold hydrolase [Gordonia terrae]|uniref:alpha/beta fold hydrolase n=1 Tax=Gordonia terrae TaxID=2055 RepID=UPI003F6AD4EB
MRAQVLADTHTFDLAGHRIRYVDRGNGPAVVLVHGLMGSLHDWDEQIVALSADFRVIAVDLPGHGESDKSPGDYSLSAHAAAIRDLLGALGVDSATVVGHSFGGGVCMQMLYLFPDLVERICLIASGGLGNDVNPVLRIVSLPGSGLVVKVAASAPVRGVVDTVVNFADRRRIVPLSPSSRQAWTNFVSIADSPTRSAFLATVRAVIDHRGQTVSATRLLPAFAHVPALLIWGDRDTIIPSAHSDAVRRALPDVVVDIVAGAGHFPHLDEPAQFERTFRDFMSTDTNTGTQPVAVGRHTRIGRVDRGQRPHHDTIGSSMPSGSVDTVPVADRSRHGHH